MIASNFPRIFAKFCIPPTGHGTGLMRDCPLFADVAYDLIAISHVPAKLATVDDLAATEGIASGS